MNESVALSDEFACWTSQWRQDLRSGQGCTWVETLHGAKGGPWPDSCLGDSNWVVIPRKSLEPVSLRLQVAFQQADYVAWNVWAAINGRPLLPFKYQHLGDMMSLGSVNGAVTLPLPVPAQLADSLQASICRALRLFSDECALPMPCAYPHGHLKSLVTLTLARPDPQPPQALSPTLSTGILQSRTSNVSIPRRKPVN